MNTASFTPSSTLRVRLESIGVGFTLSPKLPSEVRHKDEGPLHPSADHPGPRPWEPLGSRTESPCAADMQDILRLVEAVWGS